MQDFFSTELFLLLLAFTGWILWQIARSRRDAGSGEEGRCAQCGYDLRASTGRCPECGEPIPVLRRAGVEHVPLRDDWPADAVNPRTPGPDESPIVVYVTRDEAEASLMASQLAARGVHSRVRMQARPDGFTDRQVVVWSGDADYARDLVVRLVGAPPSPP